VQRELSVSAAEVEQLRQRLDAAAVDRADLNGQLHTALEASHRLKAELASCQHELATANDRCAGLSSQLSAARADVISARADAASARAALDAAASASEAALGPARSRVSALEGEVSDLRARVQRADAAAAAADERARAAAAAASTAASGREYSWECERAQYGADVRAANEQLAEARAEIGRLQQALGIARDELGAARADLEAMKCVAVCTRAAPAYAVSLCPSVCLCVVCLCVSVYVRDCVAPALLAQCVACSMCGVCCAHDCFGRGCWCCREYRDACTELQQKAVSANHTVEMLNLTIAQLRNEVCAAVTEACGVCATVSIPTVVDAVLVGVLLIFTVTVIVIIIVVVVVWPVL
jgi:predicted  nucleic acid-binding Zn-ribbon protein